MKTKRHDMYETFYRNKKVLITGGLGFIGSTIAMRLVAMGAKVTLIDALIPDYGGNIFNIDAIKDKCEVIIMDVRDNKKTEEVIKGKDLIFNLAGTLSHIDSMKDPFTDLAINCVSQLSILEACRKHNPGVKIVFAGTRGQYGKALYLPVDEGHITNPTDINGINNQAGEQYHILYNNVYGIRAVSLRLTNTYGPRHQMKHHRQGIVNWFIRKIIDKELVQIFGDGMQVRDLNYVDDVVEAFLLVMANDKANGEVYNIGGVALPIKNIVEKMIEIFGSGRYELVTYPSASKAIEIGDYVADYSKIKDSLGWEPVVALEEGLVNAFEYYKKNKKHYW